MTHVRTAHAERQPSAGMSPSAAKAFVRGVTQEGEINKINKIIFILNIKFHIKALNSY